MEHISWFMWANHRPNSEHQFETVTDLNSLKAIAIINGWCILNHILPGQFNAEGQKIVRNHYPVKSNIISGTKWGTDFRKLSTTIWQFK